MRRKSLLVAPEMVTEEAAEVAVAVEALVAEAVIEVEKEEAVVATDLQEVALRAVPLLAPAPELLTIT